MDPAQQSRNQQQEKTTAEYPEHADGREGENCALSAVQIAGLTV
jgi:hypothetical protein